MIDLTTDERLQVTANVTTLRQLRGIATPKENMDIIRARLKVAETLAKEMRDGKTNHRRN